MIFRRKPTATVPPVAVSLADTILHAAESYADIADSIRRNEPLSLVVLQKCGGRLIAAEREFVEAMCALMRELNPSKE